MNLSHHIGPGRKVGFKNWLTRAFHVCQDSLTKMPTQELVNWSVRMIAKILVEMLASNSIGVTLKADNLVIRLGNTSIS